VFAYTNHHTSLSALSRPRELTYSRLVVYSKPSRAGSAEFTRACNLSHIRPTESSIPKTANLHHGVGVVLVERVIAIDE